MARIEWVEQRLLNWASWKIAKGGGNMGYGGVDLAGANGGRSGYITATVPILEAEASATDDAVDRLTPAGTVLTVVEYYCGAGGHVDKAQRLCCSVATMYARIDKAHQQLAEYFLIKQERQRTERARVEALKVGSFPR